MARKRSVTIDFVADTAGARKGMKMVSKDAKSTGKAFAGAGRGIKMAMGAVAGAAVIQFGKDMAQLGAKNEAILRRTDQVFGETADEIKAWAADSAEAFGLSQNGVLNLASAFGDLLIPMGFTRQETAEMTMEVMEAANALSEWTGGQVDTATAAEAVSKAMLGEREMLKTLGISILEADVKQRLLEKGQEDLTGAALQQAKAMATQELIFEKSADALNAYAEGGDSALRAQKNLASQVAELKDELADRLLPILSGIVDGMGGFATAVEVVMEWIDKMPPGLQAATGATAALTAALIALNANPVVAAITAITAAVAAIGVEIKQNREALDDFLTVLRSEGVATANDVEEAFRAIDGGILTDDTLVEALNDIGFAWEDVATAVTGSEEEWEQALRNTEKALADNIHVNSEAYKRREEVISVLKRLREQHELLAKSKSFERGRTKELTEEQIKAMDAGLLAAAAAEENRKALEEETQASEDAAEALYEQAIAHGEVEGATEEELAALKSLSDEKRKAADPIFALRDAIFKQKDALEKLVAVESDEESTLRDIEEAQIDVMEATGDLEYAMANLATQGGQAAVDAFVGLARESGLSEDAIEGLLDDLGIYKRWNPGTKTFTWTLNAPRELKSGYTIPAPKNQPYVPPRITRHFSGNYGNTPRHEGGRVPGPRGVPRLIEAHGGEMVLPMHKATASPSRKSERSSMFVDSDERPIEVSVQIDGREIARALADYRKSVR